MLTGIYQVGTGAVGAFYGSRLHQPNHPQQPVLVSLTCRSNYDQVRENGLELKTRSFGDYHFRPHRVFPSVSAAGTEWDYVLLCTKLLPDRVDDSAILSPLITSDRPPPTIVLVQNGLGFEHTHRERFGEAVPIISAVTVVNAEQIEPGVVRQNRWTRIHLGPYVDFRYVSQGVTDERQEWKQKLEERSEDRVTLLAELLRQGGIRDAEVHSERDLQLVRWHKLAINASMNPSSILSGGLTNAEMVADPALRTHLAGCMTEVLSATCAIFKLEKMPAHFASPEQILESTARAKGDAVKPSMLTDWELHRPLELEAILAVPIRIARRFGIELGRLEAMYAFLSQLERQGAALARL
ncbi:hypothetical protein CROQUDRAFT_38433 [Cronartium quercuum f. sp. fusiforme G11]|uniref:2-dehydropantoate 2-reductase n=1 Tax=Cronartium quercuum f. sp. fusiforme G11 TaxID=708437 RepID=A0A9P6TH10_9BASI|nr:hypothetical protein CROQUDRAFT_38433 [Cronartium quercuum f. sp. fusiforme G11]